MGTTIEVDFLPELPEHEVIFVDFETGEVTAREFVEPDDLEVQRMWEEYHEAVANGGVDFPLVEEGFAALHEAVFGAR